MRGLIYASLTILIWGVTFVNTRALLNQFSALNFVNLGFLGCLASAACFVWWNKSCKILGVDLRLAQMK